MSQPRSITNSMYEYYIDDSPSSPVGTDGTPNLRIYRSAVLSGSSDKTNYSYATSAATESVTMPAISKYNDISKYIVIHKGSDAPSASSIKMVDPSIYPAAYATGNASNASVLTNDGLLYCYMETGGKAYLYDLLKIELKSTMAKFSVYKFTFNEPNLTESARIKGTTSDDIEGQRIPVQTGSDGYLTYTRAGMFKMDGYTYYSSPAFEADAIDGDDAESIGYYKTAAFEPQSSTFRLPWKQFVMIISDQPLSILHLNSAATAAYVNSTSDSAAITGTGILVEKSKAAPYWYMLDANRKANVKSTGDMLPAKQIGENGIAYMSFKLAPASSDAVPTYVRII